jgi:hypothetical protein
LAGWPSRDQGNPTRRVKIKRRVKMNTGACLIMMYLAVNYSIIRFSKSRRLNLDDRIAWIVTARMNLDLL